MATHLVTTSTNFSYIQPLADIESKAHSPYGLPIVDNCVSCKLRCSSFFCSLSQESTRDLDEIKHVNSYPEGALVFVEGQRSEEHTSELQSRGHLVCRLLLEKKKT